MMNADGVELMKNGRQMANGEASGGSLWNLGKLLCGSGGVECIFFLDCKKFLAREVGEKKKKKDRQFWVSIRGERSGG
jgi:hypothetical protein